jgi:hypothetical protein
MSLKSIYGSFENITRDLDKKTVNNNFWEKERKNIITQVKKGKEEKKSMVMSSKKYHQAFSL